MTINPSVPAQVMAEDVEAVNVEPATDEMAARKVVTAPLDHRYQRRVDNGTDLVGVISDYHNRRGTGKSTLSLVFGDYMDRTEEGLTLDKCTMSAPELIDKYTEMPEGSALVLDEAEAQANKYNAASHVNQALRELVSMGRVEQKYLWMNMPASDQLDKDLLGLADVWVLITRRGQAIVHLLRGEPYNSEILNPQSEIIEWSDIPIDDRLRSIHNELTRQKRARLRNEEGDDQLVKESEVKDRIKKARKEERKEVKKEVAQRLRNIGLTVSDTADVVDMSSGWVSEHTG